MASEDEVKVLTFWFSPYSMRVLIALEEKGIKYECLEQIPGSIKSALLLEMNPVHKKVPVLVHNGRPVAESLISLQYIDDVWTSGPAFLSADPYDRAIARFWADFVDKKVFQAGGRLYTTKGEIQEAVKRELTESLVILEEAISGKDYFIGNKFGLVDIMFAPMICWLHTLEILGEYKIPLEEKFTGISGWIKKCMERESVRKILPQPEKVLQLATELRKKILGEVSEIV